MKTLTSTLATGIAACMLLFAPPAEAQRRIHLVENPAQSVGLKPTVQPKYAPAPLQAPANASYKQEDILIQEDFSRMTSGTEDHPDTLNCIASETSDPGIYVNPGLTSQPGWAGDDVYQAGGAAFLRTFGMLKPARLYTPLGDYSGEITVTCRVKALEAKTLVVDDYGNLKWATLTGSSFKIVAYVGGYSNPKQADTDDKIGSNTRLYEGQGWTRVTYTFKNYSGNNDGFIAFSTEGAVLIDDIEITTSPTIMGRPGGVRITDYQPTQFTIEWQPVRKAFNYYLNLYKRVYTSDTDVTYKQDFENFEPSADWTSTSNTIVDGEGKDGSKALMLENGDTLATPYNGSKYKNMLYWMKVVYPEGTTEGGMTGYIDIDVMTEDGWDSYMWYEGSSFAEEYDYFDVDMNYDTWDGFGNNYYAVRFRLSEFPEGTKIYVDAFEIPTGRPTAFEFVGGTDNSVDHGFGEDYTVYDYTEDATQTSYTFKDLDPEGEYYYCVRSHYTTTFSDLNLIHAFAVAAPEALPATDVDSRGAMTANWNKSPKATRYAANLYGVYEADKFETGHVLLEETFDNVETDATDINAPESLYNYETTPLDGYTALPGWTGTGNILVQGMLGGDVAEEYMSTLAMPRLYVANDNSIDITVKAYGNPGDILVINVGGTDYAMPFAEVEGESYGCFEGTFTVPVSGQYVTPYFYTYNYGFFLIDEIKVTQDLQAGNQVYTWLQTKETDAETTSVDFTDLTDYAVYSYDVTAYQDLDDETAASAASNMVIVDLATGNSTAISSAVDSVDPNGAEVVARYSLDGRRLTAPQRGVNILKMSDGSTRKVIVK